MVSEQHAVILSPTQYLYPGNAHPYLPGAQRKYLAQGDSWFSIGAFPPPLTTNMLLEMRFPYHACIVDCAHPGDGLGHMVEWRQNPLFASLLSGPRGERWDAILLSAGGNDLIDAASVLPRDIAGNPVSPERRLLLQEREWNSAPQTARYLSEEGWQLFSLHLEAQYQALIEFRDAPHSSNQSVPILVHLYDYPTPRYSPAASFPLHFGPWLAPALNACGIPQTDWIAVSHLLFDRLAALTFSLAKKYPFLHVVDTRGLLTAATPGSIGKNGHWINEIHPSRDGYRLLAEKYAAAVTSVVEPGADMLDPQPEAKTIPFSLRRPSSLYSGTSAVTASIAAR